MASTLTRILVHMIFSTKGRANWIASAVERDLHAYLGGICRGLNSPALAIGGTANHDHLLVSLSKTIAVSEFVMNVKKNSSKWIKSRGPAFRGFVWQEGYGAFTIGESNVAALRRYIANQHTRHRTQTFEEEFITFLDKYQIPYDPRYVFD